MNKKQKKNKEKFEQKREKERIYSTLFVPYEPAADYSINFINKNTTESELTNHKTIFEEMSWCICDTEADRNTNKGALIQLMIPNKDKHSFMVFLIEMRQIEELPKPQLVIVKQMLHHLFTSSIIMFIWGNLKAELQYFVNHSMIPFQTKVQEVNLQAIFKKWFDYALGIKPSPIKQFSQSIVAQLVSHDNLNQMEKSKNNEWSLQDAVIYTLHKYLSKKETRQIWSQGLEGLSMQQQLLVKYATFDCLSMFDLMMFIYRHHQLNQQLQQQTTEEIENFFLEWQQEVVVVKRVKNVVQVLVEEMSEESESGHERNDRYTFQRYSSIDKGTTSTGKETVASIMLCDDEIVLVNNLACNQQQVLEQVDQQQVKSNESPTSQMNEHQGQVTEHTTNQENQKITTTKTSEIKKKRKNKRSMEAKQRRNQQSSIRHRKNRYRFEVIRSLNMDVGSAKRILRQMNISVENINPVGKNLYISVKTEQQQNELNQLLPMDIFD